jgi:DNA-directed RNA polymerase subunit RPC12/RpoP
MYKAGKVLISVGFVVWALGGALSGMANRGAGEKLGGVIGAFCFACLFFIPGAVMVWVGGKPLRDSTSPDMKAQGEPESFEARCPTCGRRIVGRESLVGQDVICPECETRFVFDARERR